MFGKKASRSATEPTVIGRGALIEGNVRASGPLQVDGHIDGVVMTISDVTALRATEDALMRAEQRILALESAAVTSKLSN